MESDRISGDNNRSKKGRGGSREIIQVTLVEFQRSDKAWSGRWWLGSKEGHAQDTVQRWNC